MAANTTVESVNGSGGIISSNNNVSHTSGPGDTENQRAQREKGCSPKKSLGWLDRLLAVWILLAMITGVLLGNFVPGMGQVLQKGQLTGVSVPIGMSGPSPLACTAGKPRLSVWWARRSRRGSSRHMLTTQAVGLLVMMYPILCKVRYESLHELFAHQGLWKQLAFSIVMNWIVAPFMMVST